MSTTEAVKGIWKDADAVCFDVDSTVCADEGIDELARFCYKAEDVKKLTNEAMKGSMDFRESLSMRLNIIRPSLELVKQFLESHPVNLTPGIERLVSTLHQRKVPVYLISGGFCSLILPAAKKLNIPLENIYANRLKFYFNGEYAGFDEEQPTSRSGGKGVVIQQLKKSFGYQKLVLIGDGATDMEACPPADAFIGFGGNVVRAEVKKGALWFVTDFNELIEAISN
ncbi:phosphoserine phosphatase [Ischnura elegans]|uniref:phosphoserine phosphatase n=1 Tax=Ischnura elegans TaxID=197161 RepID=UPI001ED8993C|nr:phosphoserine phosphatase [Ischnura elegans]XP_046391328.1 phosphoserine phosphatase [Ischnura elegans]XP_046391329.1 phosphoserine phosphatase [Ischnura elegans]